MFHKRRPVLRKKFNPKRRAAPRHCEPEITRLPVFVTADVPAEVIEDFLRTTAGLYDAELNDILPTLMTSGDFAAQAAPARAPHKQTPESLGRLAAGVAGGRSPFVGSTQLELDELFCKGNAAEEQWTRGTWACLDALSCARAEEGEGEGGSPSPYSRTVLLASNEPDMEEEYFVCVKTCRVRFEDLGGEAARIETFSCCPSEVGQAGCLSVSPRAEDRGERRAAVSFGIVNDRDYTPEHLARQPPVEGSGAGAGAKEGSVCIVVERKLPGGEDGPPLDSEGAQVMMGGAAAKRLLKGA